MSAPVATPISDLVLETHPPKPYGLVQGMENAINTMKETLEICERAQRSVQIVLCHDTFPFNLKSAPGLRLSQLSTPS